jgi:hypothetical protein
MRGVTIIAWHTITLMRWQLARGVAGCERWLIRTYDESTVIGHRERMHTLLLACGARLLANNRPDAIWLLRGVPCNDECVRDADPLLTWGRGSRAEAHTVVSVGGLKGLLAAGPATIHCWNVRFGAAGLTAAQ